jgi:hypothetical protein
MSPLYNSANDVMRRIIMQPYGTFAYMLIGNRTRAGRIDGRY